MVKQTKRCAHLKYTPLHADVRHFSLPNATKLNNFDEVEDKVPVHALSWVPKQNTFKINRKEKLQPALRSAFVFIGREGEPQGRTRQRTLSQAVLCRCSSVIIGERRKQSALNLKDGGVFGIAHRRRP